MKPSFRREIRERQGSLAQLEVMALRIRQNVGGPSVAVTVRSLAALILFSFGRNGDISARPALENLVQPGADEKHGG